MITRRFRGGGTVSRAGSPSVAWYVVGKVGPSEDVSLDHILIRELSEKCWFFRAWEISYGDRPRS